MKGGYQILDLKNTAITIGVPTTVSGAYEHCDSNGKPILIKGLRGVRGVAILDGAYACLLMNSNGAFVGTFAQVYDGSVLTLYTITVTMDDSVTISAATIE